jgi:exopolysaccharide production protein ExoQ
MEFWVNRNRSRPGFDIIILFIAFLLANLRATIFVFLHPDTSVLLGPAWIEILLWLFLVIAILYRLTRNGQLGDNLSMWRRNWLLALFILLAFVSLLWSIGPVVTLFRALELLLATFVASYFGLRLSPERMMDALFWFGAVLFILSIALALGAPPTGTMYWAPFDGAWRGVYWHRNHLASITAFLSIVYLCRLILALGKRNANGILDALLYLISLVVLYFARSAAGFIVFIVLHVAVVLAWVWLQLEQRLRRGHYTLMIVGGIFAAILILTNLDFVFGLFGRDTSMTGRVGLWNNLVEVASRRPWLGYGFGAVWALDSFREEIRQLAGWPSQPLIADNGLLDIFLHLGIAGVVIFSCMLILVTVRSLLYGVRQKTLPGFFPLLVMVYAFFGNITFSLFAETEVFVWSLIIAALFMTTSSTEHAATS